MFDEIELSKIQFNPGDICVVTYDINKYNVGVAQDIYETIQKALQPTKVIMIPSGIKLEKIEIQSLIQHLQDQLL